MSDSLRAFCKALDSADHFLLASHVMPEGDAIGSVLALDSLLRRRGKRALIACQDGVPERFHFFPSGRWNLADRLPKGTVVKSLLVADCPTLERIGSVRKWVRPETKIFNIDHHVSNVRFGHHNYIRPEASACGELVYGIFKYFGLRLTRDEAAALYVSIATDTGSFKYCNTTVKSHQIAAELIQSGVDIERVNEELHGTYSLEKIHLYSVLLKRIRTSADGRVAWVALKRKDLKDTGGTYEDAEGFTDFLQYIRGVQVAFFLTELEGAQKSEVRVSLRSKGGFDISQIAVHFGGGGHRKAAGSTVKGSCGQVVQKVLTKIRSDFKIG